MSIGVPTTQKKVKAAGKIVQGVTLDARPQPEERVAESYYDE